MNEAMAAWLYQIHSTVLISLAVTLALGICVAAPWVAHRMFRLKPNLERSAAALDAFKLIGPLTGIFTAFLLLQSVNRLHDARRLVESQAMNLLQLDRALGRIDSAEAADARRAVRDYARILVDRGWPAMRAQRPSPDVATALSALSGHVDVLAKTIKGDGSTLELISAGLESIGDIQSQIEASAAGGLPDTFWLAVILLLLLMTAEAAMIVPRWVVILPLAGYSGAIGLLIGLLFVMDRPFLGDQSADPSPIERSIATLDLRAQLMSRPPQARP
ncbi:MAG TPA: hypothetical protein VGV17_19965 [Bosea sp. (in: a-proteobacteria)]|jgi:hypothetical protein|uniref:bestrophin-like domain n=1 Tax=Bosea sp. (in: a-proteobacteria) TaxID=1871050 RepID=UPI002DDDA2B6|nr:hypothetical protein [Bosea sp. (in: a-proteobacteria)]HEV2556035.1 hypothetical protein [Bosea sp. (in: a-proteobacteria)]